MIKTNKRLKCDHAVMTQISEDGEILACRCGSNRVVLNGYVERMIGKPQISNYLRTIRMYLGIKE